MEKKTGAGANVEAPEGRRVTRDTSASEIAGSFAIFESLEVLRTAPAEPERASAEVREDGEEGSLQAVLNHYTDWLRTLDK